jgi:hypothetical protein
MAQMTRSTIKPFAQDTSTSDSPSSSSDSHQSQLLSSSGTSPEPSFNSPRECKPQDTTPKDDCGCGKTSPSDGEISFCAQLGLACGNIRNPIPAAREHKMQTPNDSGNTAGSMDGSKDESSGVAWLTQQNGGQFDPVLFGDWREPQDAILSQDFGTFFNDAFPLPDLGSPSHNITEATNEPTQKKDLLSLIDDKLNEDEVVPGEDKSKMLSCNKIWYAPYSWTSLAVIVITDIIPTGIVCNPWRSSATARSTLTISAPNSVPRRGVPRVEWSWTKAMSMLSWAASSSAFTQRPISLHDPRNDNAHSRIISCIHTLSFIWI